MAHRWELRPIDPASSTVRRLGNTLHNSLAVVRDLDERLARLVSAAPAGPGAASSATER